MKQVDRLALKQDNGDLVKMGGDGHVGADMFVYDFTAPGMCELFNSACTNATRTGMVDGCFLGGFTCTYVLLEFGSELRCFSHLSVCVGRNSLGAH